VTFEIMAYVMTLAACVLGLRFVLAGASILNEWGLETTQGALVVCRRLGAVYLGIALMFFVGRRAPPSELRSAVCLGMAIAIALLAALGLFERWAKRVGPRILVASGVEILLAGCLAWSSWSE
jgi:hypothetical protein